MNIIVQEVADGQDSLDCGLRIADCGLNVKSDSPNPQSAINTPQLILLPGAEVCETREYSARVCFQVRYAGSRITFWHTAWFPTKRVLIREAAGVRIEAEYLQAALDFLFSQNGHKYEAVLEDRGQRPGDAR